MPIDDLITSTRPSPFTSEDRISHTTKMVERTFGRPVADLGEVVMVDGVAVLGFKYADEAHTLAWRRQQNGAIFWYLDGGERPIVLSDSTRALARLQAALER